MRTALKLSACCAATVGAFTAPKAAVAPTKALHAELDSMAGVSIECGDVAFDPLELAQWRDFDELRETEIANGRSAMLAVVGWVWPQVFGLWKGGPVQTTDPIEAIAQVPGSAWAQMIALCGALEAAKVNWKSGIERDQTQPFFDPFGLYPEDAEGQAKMQLTELKNGRAAMIAFSGLVVHHFMPNAVPGLGSLH